MLARVLMTPFVIGVALVWLCIGWIFAIPLIAKAVVFFTAELLIAAITQGHRAARKPTGQGLKSALVFYPNGFSIIFGTLASLDEEPSTVDPWEFGSGCLSPLFDMVRIFFLALIFWGTTALFFHHIGLVDLPIIRGIEERAVGMAHLTPALEPVSGGEGQCSVIAERANLRSAANANARPVTQLERGATLTLVRDPFTGDNWISVRTGAGELGFIARSTIECSVPPP
jgi:hypothetical protein